MLNTRSIKSFAIACSALATVTFGAAQADAANIFLVPADPDALPAGSDLSVRVSVADLGDRWGVSLRNFSTTDSEVTGITFEAGLGDAGGPFANVGSINVPSSNNTPFTLDTNPTNPASFADSAFGFQAPGTGLTEGNADVFHFRITKIAGETRSEQDILDLFSVGGFRVAVNLIVPGIGTYEFISPSLHIPGNNAQLPTNPSTSVAPTPAALGAGLAMLSVLAMKRRRNA